jgi:hypothetical protein
MNTTLPPPRDLPPHAHARIRARLELEIGRRHPPAWLVPLVAGLAVIVLVAVLAWPRGAAPGSRPAEPGPAVSPPPTPAGERPQPGPPGVSPRQRTSIETECRGRAHDDDLQLYRVADDSAGRFALLYGPAGVFGCHLGSDPADPTQDSLLPVGPLDWLPGPVSVDYAFSIVAADWPGQPPSDGLEMVAGRVTSDVARVVYTVDGRTGEDVVTNGTYLVRIRYAASARDREPTSMGTVTAYDAAGEEIATVHLARAMSICHKIPGGTVIPEETLADHRFCDPAVPWR